MSSSIQRTGFINGHCSLTITSLTPRVQFIPYRSNLPHHLYFPSPTTSFSKTTLGFNRISTCRGSPGFLHTVF
jgi:hypothetical protein